MSCWGVCFCYTSSVVFLPPWGLQNGIQNSGKSVMHAIFICLW